MEEDVQVFLQTTINLAHINKQDETQSNEYQNWEVSRNNLIEAGYIKANEIKQIYQLQKEITELEMKLGKQTTVQAEVKKF
ncbi:MAG: hypothetical protein MRERC_6c032 [Mycoplasmataceae bacterium RC_NB112A]|nr:MAG: hypothetical protein MRERC_13c033 [Mycoplasmataceae bacterium RC_NB112A]KLL01945.1 MAG: hypothetical protein MRERC_6c032 [Mycoplasmataceae bacterium RC_NB112A]